MMNKIFRAICAAAMLCALAGCRLALDDDGINGQTDRLAGFLITSEHLDLFDFEAYVNDNVPRFSGGNIEIEGDTQKYEGRLYAEAVTETATSGETGEAYERVNYKFPAPADNAYLMAIIYEDGGGTVTSTADPGISDVKTHVNHGDGEKTTTMEGTLYITPKQAARAYYTNPVYQSADGRVYATTGSGMRHVSEDGEVGEGGIMSHTVDSSTTAVENGEEIKDSVSLKLSISVMLPPEKIVFLQMGGDNAVIRRDEYAPDEVPEALKPEPETEYIIVETYKAQSASAQNPAGGAAASREIYGRNSEPIETFRPESDGVCVKQYTQIEWP